jgi:hypothetical protein
MTIAEFKEHLAWIHGIDPRRLDDEFMSEEVNRELEGIKQSIRMRLGQTVTADNMKLCECLILCLIVRICRLIKSQRDEREINGEIGLLTEFIELIKSKTTPTTEYSSWVVYYVISAYAKSKAVRLAESPMLGFVIDPSNDGFGSSWRSQPLRLMDVVEFPGSGGSSGASSKIIADLRLANAELDELKKNLFAENKMLEEKIAELEECNENLLNELRNQPSAAIQPNAAPTPAEDRHTTGGTPAVSRADPANIKVKREKCANPYKDYYNRQCDRLKKIYACRTKIMDNSRLGYSEIINLHKKRLVECIGEG